MLTKSRTNIPKHVFPNPIILAFLFFYFIFHCFVQQAVMLLPSKQLIVQIQQ